MRLFLGLVPLLALASCAKGSKTESDMPDATITVDDAAIDGNNCSVQPCSILPQCGCNGNTACDVDTSDYAGTACRTINLEGTEISTCTNSMECDRGYVCLGDSSFASCKKYCEVDADCGTPRAKCEYTVTNGSSPIADIPKVCSSNCTPTDTTATLCPPTYGCRTYQLTNMDQVADCSPAGAGTQGAACTNDSACAKGFQCVQFGSSAFKCARICDQSAPVCPSSTSCINYATPMIIGGVTYGVCGP